MIVGPAPRRRQMTRDADAVCYAYVATRATTPAEDGPARYDGNSTSEGKAGPCLAI